MNAPVIPDSLKNHPRLGQWLEMGQDGRIHAYSGKVDIGQGILHALRLIVAEELQMDPGQVEMVRATTASSPDEAVTSGSLSIQHSGAALRYAAAHLREACRDRFAEKHGLVREAVHLENGTFFAEGGKFLAAYSELLDTGMLAEQIDPLHLKPRGGKPSALGDVRRLDIEQKVFGEFEFINDIVLPRMCFGQVFRPKTLTAEVDTQALTRLVQELAGLAGVIKVVQDGILVGLLAEAEHVLAQADKKAQKADIWRGAADVPSPARLADWLKTQPLDTTVIVEQRPATPLPRPRPCLPGRLRAQLFAARVDRPVLRDRAMERGPAAGLEPLPGHLQPAARPGAGVRHAAGSRDGLPFRRRGMLRPQRRR